MNEITKIVPVKAQAKCLVCSKCLGIMKREPTFWRELFGRYLYKCKCGEKLVSSNHYPMIGYLANEEEV